MKRRPASPLSAALPAIAVLALAGAFALAPSGRAQSQTLQQTFEGTTAPGWVLGGSGFTPILTAANGIDPSGSGWLRLTSSAGNESTYAYDSTAFSSANATITAQFNLAAYNGTGADGITFFLADASVPFAAGAYGGSLGYAQKTAAGGGGADIDGMAGGYLGIGVDEFGNYSNPTEGRIGGPGLTPNAIAVRGPGSGLNGYNYLGGTSGLSTPLSYPGQTTRPSGSEAVTIQMVLTATNQLTVSIATGGSGVFTPVFTADLSGYTRPNSLIMGFTGSTGGSTDIHEIQAVTLTSVTANIWTNTSADSTWNNANNWANSPPAVPAAGADVLLNNTYVSSAQNVSVGSNQIIRSLQIDAPFSYSLSGGSLEFNNEGVIGPSGILVSQTNGNAVQSIASNLTADNAIEIQNSSASALNLTGTLALGANQASFNGTGVVNESGIISGTGSVAQSGTGTTNFSAANTYSGGTTISEGTLNANNNAALGTGSVTLSGGTLGSTNSNSISNNIALTGSAELSGITTTGTLTQTGGNFTLNMENATQTGGVTLTNTGTTARTLTVETDSGTSAINGVISNGTATGSSLMKTGGGTLQLGAVNTYTGATTVSAGTLQLTTNNAINSGSAVALNGGTLDLNGFSDSVGTLTFTNGTIDFGTTGTPKNTLVVSTIGSSSSGVLTIDDWTSGNTTLAATTSGIATSLLNDVYFAGVGSGAVEATGAKTATGNGEPTGYIIKPNTSFVVWDGASNSNNWNSKNGSTSNWVGNGVPSTSTTSTQKLEFTGSTRLTPTMDQNYSANALLFDTAAGAFTITQNNKTLTMDGTVPSIIQESASNQIISGGTVAFGTVNGVIDVSGAGSLTIGSKLTGSGQLSKLSDGTLILSGANTGLSGTWNLGAGYIDATVANALGSGAVVVASGGTLELGTASSFSNAVTASGSGVGGVGAIYAAPTSGTATLTHQVTLGADTTIGAGSGTLALTGGITGSNYNTTFSGAGNITMSSAITTGTGGVTLNGTGTTTFSGANTYTGTTTVNSGTLSLSNTAIDGDLTVNGGTVTEGASNQIADTSNLTVNGGTFNLNGKTETVASFGGTPGGTLALGAGTLTDSGTTSTSFGGSITGTGTFDKENTSKLVLSGTSTGFTGTMDVNNGIVAAMANNATGTATVSVASSGNFEVQGGISLGSSFNLSTDGSSTGNGAIENVSGNNTITGAITVSANSRVQSDAGTLTFTGATAAGANTLNVGGNGNTTINGAITGTSASVLSKDGTGTLALGASNSSFAGSVSVTGGSLQFNTNNALTSTTAVTVASGASLNLNSTTQSLGTLTDSGGLLFGTGAILTLGSGSSTLSGTMSGSGTLVIGAGTTLTLGANFNDANLNITLAGGTLKLNGTTDTFGNLNVTAGSILDFANPSQSILTVNGVNITGSAQLSVNNWANTVDYFYSLTNPGTQGQSPLNQVVFNGFSGNSTKWNTYDSGPGGLQEITPAPEPATYGAIFVGVAFAAVLIRRRRSAAV